MGPLMKAKALKKDGSTLVRAAAAFHDETRALLEQVKKAGGEGGGRCRRRWPRACGNASSCRRWVGECFGVDVRVRVYVCMCVHGLGSGPPSSCVPSICIMYTYKTNRLQPPPLNSIPNPHAAPPKTNETNRDHQSGGPQVLQSLPGPALRFGAGEEGGGADQGDAGQRGVGHGGLQGGSVRPSVGVVGVVGVVGM